MFDADLWRIPASWLSGSGAASDVVICTRARLARNLVGVPFPHHADASLRHQHRREVEDRISQCDGFRDAWAIHLADISDIERRALIEMHLASLDLINEPEGRGLVVSRDRCRSVMINEEDLLRIQAFEPGFAPLDACQEALKCDNELEDVLEFAFSEELGYLTACPTNLGTGCRLSALVHLPGLVLGGEIEKILNSLRQLQFAVRGLFGEGSTVQGALFQISNLTTLGRTEQDIATDFARHVSKVVHYERMAQARLYERDPSSVEDLAHRALAILQHARIMTSHEALERLSQIRLGMALEVLPAMDMGMLNATLIQHQSAHLQLRADRSLTQIERGRMRADALRALLRDI